MGRPGRKRQLLAEGEYWRLLQSGVGTVQACRLAGITRKTGYRWRFESGGIPLSGQLHQSAWSACRRVPRWTRTADRIHVLEATPGWNWALRGTTRHPPTSNRLPSRYARGSAGGVRP